MAGRFKRVFLWFYWALIALLVVIVSFVFWASHDGWQFNMILSGSMEPVFHVGGLVIIRPVNPETLKIGDPISFNLPNMNVPVCHRIVGIVQQQGTTYVKTKGDANEEADQNLVPLSDINGKAVLHIPYVGRLDQIKKFGTAKVAMLGASLPAGALLVTAMGLIFILLTFKDTLENIFRPSKAWRRETLKRRKSQLQKRRLAYKI